MAAFNQKRTCIKVGSGPPLRGPPNQQRYAPTYPSQFNRLKNYSTNYAHKRYAGNDYQYRYCEPQSYAGTNKEPHAKPLNKRYVPNHLSQFNRLENDSIGYVHQSYAGNAYQDRYCDPQSYAGTIKEPHAKPLNKRYAPTHRRQFKSFENASTDYSSQSYGKKSYGKKSYGKKSFGKKSYGKKSYGKKSYARTEQRAPRIRALNENPFMGRYKGRAAFYASTNN